MDSVRKAKKAAYMRKYRKNNPEYREKERKQLREWRKRNPDKMKKYRLKRGKQHTEDAKKHALKYPDKKKARNRAPYLSLASECATCGSKERLEHHHPDYSRPDHTITLCKACHTKIHWIEYE